jgi:hypothetical protein
LGDVFINDKTCTFARQATLPLHASVEESPDTIAQYSG